MIKWNQNMGKNRIVLHGYQKLYCLCKAKGIYVGISKDVETRFYIPSSELDRPLPKAKKNKK